MYSKGIKRTIDSDTDSTETIKTKRSNRPCLIRKVKELDSDSEADSEADSADAVRQSHSKASRFTEEERLRKLMNVSDVCLKTQILNCNHPDLIKSKCLQYLKLYEDDPENNSTSLTALQLILSLPTSCVSSSITTNQTHEEITLFLSRAWDHMEKHVYGQQHAKSEIIEYIVSRLLTNNPRVLGLVGPPGVGKTSLAIHGISKAMGIPFHHISIGGLKDVTYFSGSFRCYKGSRHGMFTDILINEKCLNPIIYIDELDKISLDTAQEIYGILTHATDPLTNKSIHDCFLGIDLDLSKVTFIFSYNDIENIPLPLRDRIKEIYLGGFNIEDKIILSKNFIIPNCLKEYGVTSTDIIFTEDIITYANKKLTCRYQEVEPPAGVRYLIQGFQSLIGKLIVNIIGSKNSYLQYCKIITPTKSRPITIKTKPYVAPNFAPKFRQINLPYTVCIDDIDFYIT